MLFYYFTYFKERCSRVFPPILMQLIGFVPCCVRDKIFEFLSTNMFKEEISLYFHFLI